MLKALVDRIDGNSARVLVGDEEVAVYISMNNLPPNTREGVVLQVKFSIDSGATNARDAAIRATKLTR